MKKAEFNSEWKNPSAEYRSVPFWAWNDKLDISEIKRQIREMKAQGIGGFFMHSRDGLETEYLGGKWLECAAAAADEAKKNNMRAWLYDEDRWPSGTCGGRNTKSDQNSCKGLTLEVCSKVPEEIDGNVLAVYTASVCDMDIFSLKRLKNANQASLKPNEVLLIARLEVSGKSEWFNNSAPPDNLSFEAVRDFIDSTHEVYKKLLGDEFGKTVPGIFTDEPSLADRHAAFNPNRSWIPWTGGFEDYFFEKRGYDALDTLPYIYFNGSKSSKIRHDYWRTVSERFKEAYSLQIADWCRKNNLSFTGHFLQEDKLGLSCRVNGSVMPHYAVQDIPAIDMLTERTDEYITVKQCVSVASQLGKDVVLSETYGCTGWDFSFEGQKWVGDWQYALGVNLRCQHLALYSLRGGRKRDYPPSINFNNSWWHKYKSVEDYFARMSYILRCGKAVRNVLVIHPATTAWSRMGCSPYGNPKRKDERDVPKLNELGDRLNMLIKSLCQKHYDCDLGDEIVIKEHGSCRDGKFVIGECEYSAVILPYCENLLHETEELLFEFMENGGTVLGIAPLTRLIDGEAKNSKIVFHKQFIKLSSENKLFEYLEKNVTRTVSVTNRHSDRTENENILYQLRYDGSGYILFLANNDRENAQDLRIELTADMQYLYSADALSGKLNNRSFEADSGTMSFDEYMQGCRSSIFYITNKKLDCEEYERPTPQSQCKHEIKLKYIGGKADTENILTLDKCKYVLGSDLGSFSKETEVWKAQCEIREKLQMRQINLNGGEQRYRWINKPHENNGAEVMLEFEFISETDISGAELVIERPECFSIELDGSQIEKSENGYFLDCSFKRLKLPKITRGSHTLTLKCEYKNDMELEACYLLGDFGVSDKRTLIEKPAKIELGDITKQGYFHYIGGIEYQYKCAVTKTDGQRFYLDSGSFSGTASSAVINGHTIDIPWKSAGSFEIGEFLNSGENTISINIYGSPRNMLGPLHIKNKPLVTKDSCFCPSDSSEEYNVIPTGLMKPPKLICD